MRLHSTRILAGVVLSLVGLAGCSGADAERLEEGSFRLFADGGVQE